MSRPDSGARRALRTFAAILAALTFGWAVVLFVTGGFDTHVLGMPLTAHNPYRPLLAAAIALSLYMLAGGDARVTSVAVAWTRLLMRVLAEIQPTWRRAVALGQRWHAAHVVAFVMGAALFTIAAIYGSKVGGGADSYGYLSEAELFLDGRVTDPQPWARDVPWPNAISTFAPLGYRAAPEHWLITPPIPHAPRDPWTITPTYAPGLPLLMALFKRIAGQPGVFLVSPLAGGLLVFATFAIGRRLGSAVVGLLAAWLVATSPNVLEMTLGPMSDVPVAAAWACAYWGLLGRSMRSGIGAAFAGAIAILIRPNLFFMTGPVFLLVVQQACTAPASERTLRIWRGFVVMCGLGAGIAAAASFNWAINGSPFMSGYGTLRDVLDWVHVAPNLKNYTRWFVEAQTPIAVLGFLALLVPLRWFWPDVPHRTTTIWCLAAFVLGVWIEYFYWGVFETGLYLRFLLSTWPFIMIGLSAVVLAPARSGGPIARRLTMAAGVIFLVSLGLRGFLAAEAAGVFTQRLGESKYVTAALEVRRHTPENSVVFSMQHSGSLRYYAGRMTLRYDQLPGDWLSRSVAYLSSQGLHSYLLLDDWEREQFEGTFRGDATAAVVRSAPMLRYREVSLFDLAPAADAPKTTILLPDSTAVLAVTPPAPPPSLVLRK